MTFDSLAALVCTADLSVTLKEQGGVFTVRVSGIEYADYETAHEDLEVALDNAYARARHWLAGRAAAAQGRLEMLEP